MTFLNLRNEIELLKFEGSYY